MDLSDSLSYYLKINTSQTKNVTNIIKMKHKKNQGIYPMGLFSPWDNSFIHN